MNERTVFLDAVEIDDPIERRAHLDRACAGDPGLREVVERLLAAHEKDGPFLDRPAQELLETVDRRDLSERAGKVIGPYKLMEQIGEGGFGLVFVAEQLQPVRRKVALKVIKPGMDTREVIARFEAERQALALMDHPNIAKVLDAGTTESGLPYFVMELVKGIPVTDYCDHAQLTPRERLELFLPICQAVQHAHQKGVIHRDLKPSNVLVTLHDGNPVVKVIDFGVAKAIGQHLTEKTIYTRFAQMIGTPLYMSPEQAEMSGLDIDTRSDIYSLGVLLYELLTGTTPFDRQRFGRAAFDEIRRIIREEEPPRPSTRLTSLSQTLPSVSAKRKTETKKLSALVKGDLDWIVMKALEKDRSRRYETASAFAADVRRFLTEEPVEARPPSASYYFRKLARRNKAALTTAALVAGVLVLGTAIATWQAVRATREATRATKAEAQTLAALHETEQSRAEAVAARKKAEDFADGLQEATALVGRARPLIEQSRWTSAHAALAKAQELQPGLIAIYIFRTEMYEDLGLWDLAADDAQKATTMTEGGLHESPSSYQLALLRLHVGDEKGYRKACMHMVDRFDGNVLTVRACVLAADPATDPAALAQQAEHIAAFEKVHWHLYVAGLAHYRAGQFEQAVERLRQSLSLDPNWPARAINYPVLAMAYHRLGRADEARQALASADEAINGWTEAMIQGPVGAMPIPWFDWLECRHFYREANKLIRGRLPVDDPRLRAVHDRALGALTSGDAFAYDL